MCFETSAEDCFFKKKKIIAFNMTYTLHKSSFFFIKSKKNVLKNDIFAKAVGIPKSFDKITRDMH